MSEKMVHPWEKVEVTLQAQGKYENPYTQVDVWVDLEGPGFSKRVYGFWDGGDMFRVRITATCAGTWSWRSGSSPSDTGLAGKTGSFDAVNWTADELAQNICRHGFIQADSKGHSFVHADGTPYFLLGDTWWATPTFRYPWFDGEEKRAVGPDMGFKDMVAYRKAQGYNCIAMIAAFPNWANDGAPPSITMEKDGKILSIRNAWKQAGTNSAKDMQNEGGRPFLFPGKAPGFEQVLPDLDRINPDYFRYMDRKVDYLNDNGFVSFIEVSRRDISEAWKAFHDFPTSYARYIQYIFARYQANNCLLSPIHFDWHLPSIPSREDRKSVV